MNSNEKEEIEKAVFAEKLLQKALEEELEKEHSNPKALYLFERVGVITMEGLKKLIVLMPYEIDKK